MTAAGAPARASAAFRDAGLAAVAAFALALPMVGFRTVESENGLAIQTRFGWVAASAEGDGPPAGRCAVKS